MFSAQNKKKLNIEERNSLLTRDGKTNALYTILINYGKACLSQIAQSVTLKQKQNLNKTCKTRYMYLLQFHEIKS